MPRKTAEESNVDVKDPAPAMTAPAEVRPGAVVSPEVVNVFDKAVSPGAATGLRLAPLGGRPAGEALALSVVAWVRNIAYDKDVWVDLSVTEGETEVLHTETLGLSYQEPAEGGGDFFAVGAAVPAPKAGADESPAYRLQYRIYAQMGGQLYTDGVLHNHDIAIAPDAKVAEAQPQPAAKPPKATPKTATPKTATPKTATPKAAESKAAEPKAAAKTTKASAVKPSAADKPASRAKPKTPKA